MKVDKDWQRHAKALERLGYWRASLSSAGTFRASPRFGGWRSRGGRPRLRRGGGCGASGGGRGRCPTGSRPWRAGGRARRRRRGPSARADQPAGALGEQRGRPREVDGGEGAAAGRRGRAGPGAAGRRGGGRAGGRRRRSDSVRPGTSMPCQKPMVANSDVASSAANASTRAGFGSSPWARIGVAIRSAHGVERGLHRPPRREQRERATAGGVDEGDELLGDRVGVAVGCAGRGGGRRSRGGCWPRSRTGCRRRARRCDRRGGRGGRRGRAARWPTSGSPSWRPTAGGEGDGDVDRRHLEHRDCRAAPRPRRRRPRRASSASSRSSTSPARHRLRPGLARSGRRRRTCRWPAAPRRAARGGSEPARAARRPRRP